MQDFKNIHKKKRHRHSRRKVEEARNAFRTPVDPQPRKKKLRVILPALALVLASYPLFGLVSSARTALSTPQNPSSSSSLSLKKVDNWSSFNLAAQALPSAQPDGNGYSAPLPQGGRVVYALNERLQTRVAKVMQDFQVPYATLVAIEPKTGKIIAAVSHSSVQPEWAKDAYYKLYPMASLFKIVTAAAALEDKKVTADTPFAFNGRLTSESPKYWGVKPGRGNQEMSLALAMGKSVNPVFGRLAGDVVGRDPLLNCAQKFGFNEAIFPGCPILPSTAPPPATVGELMRMGAGLNHDVKVSPVHAATLMAAVANGGVMMAPSLAAQVLDAKGGAVYTQQPQVLRRVVTPETAAELARMLATTTVSGTSRKAFHDRRGRPMLDDLKVAAKTGSIDGTDPAGHYSWFSAYAPMEDPQIAIAALVINGPKWRIKAPYLGEQALEAFFK